MRNWALLCVAAVLGLAGQRLSADIVTIGAANNGNCIPFGCAGANGIIRYQQVYDATSFVTPFDIAAVSFFDTFSLGSGGVTHATYTLSLSTTSRAVGALDSLNLDLNVGLDSRAFFSGDLGGFAGTKLTIGGPVFHYDPAFGNLLLDINISGAGADALIAMDAEENSTVISRAGTGLIDLFPVGLVTEFDSTTPPPMSTVPEPKNAVLLGTVLAGIVVRAVLAQIRKLGRVPPQGRTSRGTQQTGVTERTSLSA